MSKKICILNGSPRPKGNTKALITSFIKGAEAAGNEILCFDLQRMDIHGCLGAAAAEKTRPTPVCSGMTWKRSIRPTGRRMW